MIRGIRNTHYHRWGKKGGNLRLYCVGIKRYTSFKHMHMYTLTLSDVVKGPLVVLEERVALDLIHSGAAQSNLPAHRTKTVSRASSAGTRNTPPPVPSTRRRHQHPKHTGQWSDH